MKERFSRKSDAGKQPVKIETSIPTHRIWDMLVGAFEGGSNYWYVVTDINYANLSKEDFTYIHEVPLEAGCSLTIEDKNEEEGTSEKWVLNREKLEKGLVVMHDKYPKHYGDFIAENDDATTADVYLQCCLFGEIVFG